MRRVFVDTSAFVALRNRSEAEHASARRALSGLTEQKVPLVTTNLIFSETFTALLVRVGHGEALEWGRHFRSSRFIDVIRVDEAIEDDAWSLLERHDDKRWSHVDATSFATMARYGITEALTFDRHFAQQGLLILPGPG